MIPGRKKKVIGKINQHIISYNLNYSSEIAVKLMASKEAARREVPFPAWLSQ